MITYRKARELLPIGDVVYALTEDGGVEQAVVKAVLSNCLKTDKGYLDYDLHGYSWFLTKKGVVCGAGSPNCDMKKDGGNHETD